MTLKITIDRSGTGFNAGRIREKYLQLAGQSKRWPAAGPTRLIWSALVCMVTLFGLCAAAETNTTGSAFPSNRYLLIVETSRAMNKCAEGTLRAVKGLLGSSMHGELRPGDSLAVWTFNNSLYTGRLPLQEWEAGSGRAVTGQVLNFLHSQQYEKQGQLEKVLPSMLRVVKSSEFITVILVTDGSEEFHGTPYDQQINQALKSWSVQQREAKMPLVTVLRAHQGQFTGYKVTPVPWSVEMPPYPTELRIAKAAPLKASTTTAKAAPPAAVVPPLIISGKKADPAPPVPRPNLSAPQPQPALANTQSGTSSESKTQSVSNTVSSATASVTGSSPAAASGFSQPLTESGPSALTQSPATPELRAQKSEPEQAQIAALHQAASTPSPAPRPSSSEITSEPQTRLAETATPTKPETIRPEPTLATIPQPAMAIAAPTRASLHTTAIAILLLVGVTAACSCLWLLKRRSHPAGHVSLITRSFDREQH